MVLDRHMLAFWEVDISINLDSCLAIVSVNLGILEALRLD